MKIEKLLTTINEEITQNFFKEPNLKRNTSFKINTVCADKQFYRGFGILKVDFNWSVSGSTTKHGEISSLVSEIIKPLITKYNIDVYSIINVSNSIKVHLRIPYTSTKDLLKQYFIKNENCFQLNYNGDICELVIQTKTLDLLEFMDNLIEIDYDGDIYYERPYSLNSVMFSMIKRNKKLGDLLASTIDSDCEIPYCKSQTTIN